MQQRSTWVKSDDQYVSVDKELNLMCEGALREEVRAMLGKISNWTDVSRAAVGRAKFTTAAASASSSSLLDHSGDHHRQQQTQRGLRCNACGDALTSPILSCYFLIEAGAALPDGVFDQSQRCSPSPLPSIRTLESGQMYVVHGHPTQQTEEEQQGVVPIGQCVECRRHHFCKGCAVASGMHCPMCRRVIPTERNLHAECLAIA